MTEITEYESAIIAEHEKKRQELSERMRKLGKSRSAKKRSSSQNNIKAAHEAKYGRPYGYKKMKVKK
jgi:hypothetical protein